MAKFGGGEEADGSVGQHKHSAQPETLPPTSGAEPAAARDEQDAPASAVAVPLDIRLTRFTVDHLPDAAYWIERDAAIVYANAAASQLLGYSRAELLRMHVYELNPEVPEERWYELWEQLRAERHRTFETVHRSKSGAQIPVEISANYMEFDGKALGCAFARDIRDRKRLENRLRQAEKMEAIGRLAGGVAHDFNNQLMGIMGYADLLERELQEDTRLLQLVQNILLGVQRSAELTGQLLTFSRRGKHPSEPTSVHRIVREVCDLLCHGLDENIRVEQRLRAGTDIVRADPSKLHNAILNLALNARDAMKSGGTLSISTNNVYVKRTFFTEHAFKLEPGRHLKLVVSDTGQGIPPESAPRIFEPFFTTKGKGLGTGLGLSAVYGTIKNHQGAIRVRSEVGKGTRLEVFLPVASTVETSRGHTLQERVPARVLFISDERSHRGGRPRPSSRTQRILRRLGYRVVNVASTTAAVEYYAKHALEVDAVIFDQAISNVSALATLATLERHNPQVKALSASGQRLGSDSPSTEPPISRDAMPGRDPVLAEQLASILSSAARRGGLS